MRPSNRNINQIRPVSIKTDIIKNAEGSCNIKCGNTEIICTATIDENVPHLLEKTGLGWVTAEYSMLPRSTNSRMKENHLEENKVEELRNTKAYWKITKNLC